MTIKKVEPGRKVRIDILKSPGLFPVGTIGVILNSSSDTCIKVSVMNDFWYYDKEDLSYLPDNDNNSSQTIKEEIKEDSPKYRTLEAGEWIVAFLGDERFSDTLTKWIPTECGDYNWTVEPHQKGLYRRPIRTTSTIPTTDISSYPIEDLIEWRDKASARVSKIDKDIIYVQNIIKEQSIKFEKLQRQRQHDIKWIVKLNRILYNRVIKERK